MTGDKDAQKQEVYEVIDYKGDVLILHGDEDPIVPFEYSERAAETYESCELVKMDGEGHGWSEEAWPKAIEMVLDFFEKALMRRVSQGTYLLAHFF